MVEMKELLDEVVVVHSVSKKMRELSTACYMVGHTQLADDLKYFSMDLFNSAEIINGIVTAKNEKG